MLTCYFDLFVFPFEEKSALKKGKPSWTKCFEMASFFN